jgi:hypothetical protein
MIRRTTLLVAASLSTLSLAGWTQNQTGKTDKNVRPTLEVQVERDTRMQVGKPVRAKTVYPLYIDNQLVVPVGSEVIGKITKLDPAPKKERLNAKLGGDFTPLHSPHVQFDEMVLPGGNEVTIETLPSSGGVEIVRFQALTGNAAHPSLVKKLWAEAIGREKEAVRTFTAPGKKDRALRMLYSELPYHPELLTAGTQFAVEFASATSLPLGNTPLKPTELNGAPGEDGPPNRGVDATVKLAAELVDDIDSQHAVPGTKIRAVVTEPLFNKDQHIQVPQGTILMGEITQAEPAGRWGKGGVLRFSFRELQFPEGFAQRVHGAPVAVDTDQSANLRVDQEGGVKPGPKGFGAPLVMGLLATSAVHEDEASFMHTAVTANGFALIGRVLSLATHSQYVGAAFGFYGTGRSVYSKYIARGADVSFPKHTRVEVVLDPERVKSLKPGEVSK